MAKDIKIQVKRGPKAGIPYTDISEGEPIWATDTKELFIGGEAGTYHPIHFPTKQLLSGKCFSKAKGSPYNHCYFIPVQIPYGYRIKAPVQSDIVFARAYSITTNRVEGTESDMSFHYVERPGGFDYLVVRDTASNVDLDVNLYYNLLVEFIPKED